jgi:hypothetical protein
MSVEAIAETDQVAAFYMAERQQAAALRYFINLDTQ